MVVPEHPYSPLGQTIFVQTLPGYAPLSRILQASETPANSDPSPLTVNMYISYPLIFSDQNSLASAIPAVSFTEF